MESPPRSPRSRAASTAEEAPPVFTVGHSTHSLETLIGLLRPHRIACLIDVRSYPRSRRMPHFSAESLARSLPAEGIDYIHCRRLGGRRRAINGSPNTGWRSEGFRGYADHMATADFEAALAELEAVARRRRSVVMCAEALWWRCHRRLISDALVVAGWRVLHIESGGATKDHELTPFAVVEGRRIVYPAAQATLELEA